MTLGENSLSEQAPKPLPPTPSWSQLGLATTPSWAEQDEKLRELWATGEKPEKIAEILGRSEAAIMTRAARLGLPRRFAPGRKAQPGQIKKASGVATPRRYSSATNTNLTEPPPQMVERVCLMCLSKFPSVGRQNRICGNCKDTPEYRTAMQVTEYDLRG